jgi:GNAT superfamily N-acetyltransferase
MAATAISSRRGFFRLRFFPKIASKSANQPGRWRDFRGYYIEHMFYCQAQSLRRNRLNTPKILELELLNYTARQLEHTESDTLQQLLEHCADFCILVEGQPPSPPAGKGQFFTVPKGKELRDKFAFGLIDGRGVLVGVLDTVRHYPDDKTWWLGLLMLAPEKRGAGLGTSFYQAFEHWLVDQGARRIMLAVVEANKPGLLFWQNLGFEKTRKAGPKRFGNQTHHLLVLERIMRTTDD